jgi:hypothetical protein
MRLLGRSHILGADVPAAADREQQSCRCGDRGRRDLLIRESESLAGLRQSDAPATIIVGARGSCVAEAEATVSKQAGRGSSSGVLFVGGSLIRSGRPLSRSRARIPWA